MKNAMILLSLISSSVASASTHRIHVENLLYPGRAEVHLDATQVQLAEKAIEICGGQENVMGLGKILISVTEGISNSVHEYVGTLARDRGLAFFYPQIVATAVLECK